MVRAAERWGPERVQDYQEIIRQVSLEQAVMIDKALEQFNCGEPVLFFPCSAQSWSLIAELGVVWCSEGQLGFAQHTEIESASSQAPGAAGRQLSSQRDADHVFLTMRNGRTIHIKTQGEGLSTMIRTAQEKARLLPGGLR